MVVFHEDQALVIFRRDCWSVLCEDPVLHRVDQIVIIPSAQCLVILAGPKDFVRRDAA